MEPSPLAVHALPEPDEPKPEPAAEPAAKAAAKAASVPALTESRVQVIEAYWDDIEERVAYLMALLGAGRHNETLSLCAVYLEGVAHALVSSDASETDWFGDQVGEHADDPFLSLIHPLQLVRVSTQLSGLSPSASHGLAARFPGPEQILLRKEDALAIVHATLAHSDAALVERAIWKCTIAYVVYDFINTQSFRSREGGRTIGLGPSFREGMAIQGLSVPELVSLLRAMIAEARSRSLMTGRLPDQG